MGGATDDQQLMNRYAAGDLAAFEALYARHRGPLYRYVLRQCGNADTANELFQDVWGRIIQARANREPTSRFTLHIYQIAHSCLVNHFRKRNAMAAPVAEQADPAFASARWSLVDWEQGQADSPPGPVVAASGVQRTARLRSALDSLPIEQREAFLLHEEAEMGLADIAAVTGASAEVVKRRLGDAVKTLRNTLGDMAPASPRGPLS